MLFQYIGDDLIVWEDNGKRRAYWLYYKYMYLRDMDMQRRDFADDHRVYRYLKYLIKSTDKSVYLSEVRIFGSILVIDCAHRRKDRWQR